MLTASAELLRELQAKINILSRDPSASLARTEKILVYINQALISFKEMIKSYTFAEPEEEVKFFKEINPEFYALWFYYSSVYSIQSHTFPGSSKSRIKYLGHDMELMTVKGLSYKEYKLFLISILWRAHVSKNIFFKKIHIPDLEPIIRNKLINDDPGTEDDFKIAVVGIRRANGQLSDFVLEPDMRRENNSHFVHFIIGGFIYFIELKENSGFTLMDRYFLKQSGDMEIPLLSGEIANDMLKALGLPKTFRDVLLFK